MTLLANLRETEGLSRLELARELNLHYNTIATLERGERQIKFLSHDVVVKMQTRFRMPIEKLLANCA